MSHEKKSDVYIWNSAGGHKNGAGSESNSAG